MKPENRRAFLKTATTAAAYGALAGASARGANDTIRVGVVGIRGRGGDHIGGYLGLKDHNVEVAALCDVDEGVLNDRQAEVQQKSGKEVKTFTDYRTMLEKGGIDAVSIATPNHWHSLMGIWACQAGKDVYVEKPLSHNIHEGRKLVEAARKYNSVVQHGTQIRSSRGVREAMQMLHEGVIGEVYYAKGTCYKWRDTIGHADPRPEAPEGVHYNLWLGPAPQRAFSQNRFHYNWHWHWDYGNGDIGNQGVHQMDVARWGLGVGMPDMVSSIGGHFMFDDDQETPNTLVSSMKYENENKMLVFEVRHWITNDELGFDERGGNVVGNLFLGSKGMMVVPSYNSYAVFFGRERKPGPEGSGGGDHYLNFIQAMRSRNLDELHADVEEGHLSSALCHLANASYRVKRTLHIDRATERAIGDDAANELLTRNYRNPFVVPEEV